jgi:glycosyltransferase involved in cell wall biosynthesis/SAM-dependent methyltransferase
VIRPLRVKFHRRLRRRAERLARRLSPYLPPGARFLDIGSGTGHNARALRLRTGGSCLEADVVDFHVVGGGPMLFDGMHLPLADDEVDVSLIIHALSYADDPVALLREAGRVASRGVILIQSTYRGPLGRVLLRVRSCLQGRLSFWLCRALGLIPAVPDTLRPRRMLSRERLEAIIGQSGLFVRRLEPERGLASTTSRDLLILDRNPMNMPDGLVSPTISVIIPARNEEALLASTLESVIRARAWFATSGAAQAAVEILVVDNCSTDRTCDIVEFYADSAGVRAATCVQRGAARSRNLGAELASGQILIFLDADTHLPLEAIRRIATLCWEHGYEAGITRLGALDGGWFARYWWAFWNAVRKLPLARAKAMPACMFCARAAFAEFGPFDERVAIGEEWPILAGLYRSRRDRLIYDCATVALSSSRRMELQRFGYLRTFAKYVWAILSYRGRVHYDDGVRHASIPAPFCRVGFEPSTPRHGWSGWLGAKLSRVRLNVIKPRHAPGHPPLIAKRRRWFSRWIIAPGNLYLRWLDSKVRVLPDRLWQRWECEVHRQLYGFECRVDSRGWLLLPHWPGTVLAEYGADIRLSRDDRLRGLARASHAMRGLHLIDMFLYDGTAGRFSHGDATLKNVMYDPSSVRARWFDFDTVHDPSEPPLGRHADDLRALLYSALETFFDVPVSVIVETVKTAYDDRAVWDHLRVLHARKLLHTSTYHLAQASPAADRREEAERLLGRCRKPLAGRQ